MVLYYRDTGAVRSTNATLTLLDDVGEFVPE